MDVKNNSGMIHWRSGMKKCTICGEKIKQFNDASTEILSADFMLSIRSNKIQIICMDCKKDLLYASIITPF